MISLSNLAWVDIKAQIGTVDTDHWVERLDNTDLTLLIFLFH